MKSKRFRRSDTAKKSRLHWNKLRFDRDTAPSRPTGRRAPSVERITQYEINVYSHRAAGARADRDRVRSGRAALRTPEPQTDAVREPRRRMLYAGRHDRQRRDGLALSQRPELWPHGRKYGQGGFRARRLSLRSRQRRQSDAHPRISYLRPHGPSGADGSRFRAGRQPLRLRQPVLPQQGLLLSHSARRL